jgi:hypothetical protein
MNLVCGTRIDSYLVQDKLSQGGHGMLNKMHLGMVLNIFLPLQVLSIPVFAKRLIWML